MSIDAPRYGDDGRYLHSILRSFREKYGPFAHVEDVGGELVVVPYREHHCLDGSTWRVSTFGRRHHWCRHECVVGGTQCETGDYIEHDSLDDSYDGIVNNTLIYNERDALAAVATLSPYIADYEI